MNYGLRRYLDHSSDKKIADRLRYVVENLTTPSPDGKVGASVPNPHGSWLELFAHIQEEYRLRKAEFPADVLKGARVPNPLDPLSQAAVRSVSATKAMPWKNLLPNLAPPSVHRSRIDPRSPDDHSAYIGSWIKVAKNDKRAIFTAASHARRAADFLHGLQKPVAAPAA